MNLEKNAVYKITHSRKGTFTVRVTAVGDFTTGEIVDGVAGAILDVNVREKGEEIIFRTSFVTSAELIMKAA